MQVKNFLPDRKVNAVAIGGAIATLLIWGIQTLWPNLEIPEPVVAAITTLIVFVISYLTPAAPGDSDRHQVSPVQTG